MLTYNFFSTTQSIIKTWISIAHSHVCMHVFMQLFMYVCLQNTLTRDFEDKHLFFLRREIFRIAISMSAIWLIIYILCAV